MDQSLKRRLLDLGIPAERHDPLSLSALFPPEFSVSHDSMEPELLAEVVAALVARGLVSVRGSDAATAARNAAGRHLCHFYRDETEYMTLVAAFVAGAAAARERAIWVLPPWLGAAAAERALEQARAAKTDAVEFLGMGQVYLDSSGAVLPPERIIAFWRARLAEAVAAGFTGIRVTGDGTEQAASSAWVDAELYEKEVDEALAGAPITGLCTYSLRRVPAVRLGGTLRSHRAALVRRGALWDELPSSSASATVLSLLQASLP